MSRGMVIGSSGAPMEIGEITLDNKSDQIGNGFLLCNGTNINKNQYPDLYMMFKKSNLSNFTVFSTPSSLSNPIMGITRWNDLLIFEDIGYAIYTSNDEGITLVKRVSRLVTEASGPFQRANTAHTFQGDVYALSFTSVWKSTDGGSSFQRDVKILNDTTYSLGDMFTVKGYLCVAVSGGILTPYVKYKSPEGAWSSFSSPKPASYMNNIYYDPEYDKIYMCLYANNGMYELDGSKFPPSGSSAWNPILTDIFYNKYTYSCYFDSKNRIFMIVASDGMYVATNVKGTINTVVKKSSDVAQFDSSKFLGGNNGYVIVNDASDPQPSVYYSNNGTTWNVVNGISISFAYHPTLFFDEKTLTYMISLSDNDYNIYEPKTITSKLPNAKIDAYIRSGIPQS